MLTKLFVKDKTFLIFFCICLNTSREHFWQMGRNYSSYTELWFIWGLNYLFIFCFYIFNFSAAIFKLLFFFFKYFGPAFSMILCFLSFFISFPSFLGVENCSLFLSKWLRHFPCYSLSMHVSICVCKRGRVEEILWSCQQKSKLEETGEQRE